METLKVEEAVYLKIMENQSFQDLSGQTLKKIIAFIEKLEFTLLNLLNKYSGVGIEKKSQPKEDLKSKEVSEGMEVALEGPQDHVSATSQNDVDDLLSQYGF